MFHVRVLINTLVNSKVFLPLSSRIFWLKMSRPSLFVSAMKLSNSQYTVQGRIKGCKTGAGKSENINIVYISCAYAAVVEKAHVNVFSFCG